MVELPALSGTDDILVCGVWLLGMLGDVFVLEDPRSTLGGYKPPGALGRCPAGGYVFE